MAWNGNIYDTSTLQNTENNAIAKARPRKKSKTSMRTEDIVWEIVREFFFNGRETQRVWTNKEYYMWQFNTVVIINTHCKQHH
jgi:hypothetical protein